MKKLTLLLLALALTLALGGCGGSPADTGAAGAGATVDGRSDERDGDMPETDTPDASEVPGETGPLAEGAGEPAQTQDEAPAEVPAAQQPEPVSIQPAPEPVNEPAQTEAPAQSQPALQPAEQKAAPTAADASAFIGQSLSSLTAAIGQPNSSDYASSCLGEGEDGELHYNGFTVYTYRENGSETVEAVE